MLWSQPARFDFLISGTPQVGSTFHLRINALTGSGFIDPTFNETGHLYVLGPDTTGDFYLYPTIVQFQAGIAEADLSVYLADSLRLICETPALTDTSDPLLVLPGPYAHVQILLPGETPFPGTPEGKRGTPDPGFYLAPDTVRFFARLTDAYYNPVPDSDTVVFTCRNLQGENPFARFPVRPVLTGVGDSLYFSPRVAAAQTRILAQGVRLPGPDSSAQVTVLAGPPAFLLPLLPGETLLPGDTAVTPGATPGKGGTVQNQYADVPFNIQVYVVDAAYNPVQDIGPLLGDEIDLYVYSLHTPAVAATDGPKVLGTAVTDFTVTAPERGTYLAVARDLDASTYNTPYGTRVVVLFIPGGLNVWARPQTIRVQDYSRIIAEVTSPSGDPVLGKLVRFRTLNGRSQLRPNVGVTDQQGRAVVLLVPSTRDMGDTVWIVSSVDTLVDTTWVYIQGLSGKLWRIFPNPFVISKHHVTTVAYYVSEAFFNLEKVRVEIYTPFGEKVWYKEIPRGNPGAILGQTNTVQWNGENLRGQRVASGVYDVYVLYIASGQILKKWHRTLGVVR